MITVTLDANSTFDANAPCPASLQLSDTNSHTRHIPSVFMSISAYSPDDVKLFICSTKGDTLEITLKNINNVPI